MSQRANFYNIKAVLQTSNKKNIKREFTENINSLNTLRRCQSLMTEINIGTVLGTIFHQWDSQGSGS